MNLGCSDGNCLFRRNTGQATNGGCSCIWGEATHTGGGWTIPVQTVQVMVARAVQVAVERERANKPLTAIPDQGKAPAPLDSEKPL